jgi:hypothetical protein
MLEMQLPGSAVADLGAIDLFRDRERGVPPYNQLRAEIGLGRFRAFDEITPDAEVVAKLRAMYGVHADGSDRVEDIDLLVGTLCEGYRPDGFGFGETMFQASLPKQMSRFALSCPLSSVSTCISACRHTAHDTTVLACACRSSSSMLLGACSVTASTRTTTALTCTRLRASRG